MKELPKQKLPKIIEYDTQSTIDSKIDNSFDNTIDNKFDKSRTTTTTSTTVPPASASFVIKCLLRTARFMWQVTTIPAKIGDTIGTLYRYAQDSVDSFLCVAG